jgi:hypothetical protein
VQKEGREACFVCCGISDQERFQLIVSIVSLTVHIRSRGERGVLGERIGDIVVGPIRVLVGLLRVVVILPS